MEKILNTVAFMGKEPLKRLGKVPARETSFPAFYR